MVIRARNVITDSVMAEIAQEFPDGRNEFENAIRYHIVVKETYGRGSRMHGRRTGRADWSYEIRWRERDMEEAEKRNV